MAIQPGRGPDLQNGGARAMRVSHWSILRSTFSLPGLEPFELGQHNRSLVPGTFRRSNGSEGLKVWWAQSESEIHMAIFEIRPPA